MEEWSPFRAYGSRKSGPWYRPAWPDRMVFLLICASCLFLILRTGSMPAYKWQWSLLLEFVWRHNEQGTGTPGLLLQGLFTTLRVGFWTTIFALIAGGILGIATARKPLRRRLGITVFISCLRNIPPLVLLFAVYFFAGNFLPTDALENMIRQLGPAAQQRFSLFFAQPGQVDRMIAAVLALGLYQGAYMAEITRGGIESVSSGQWDAAKALGFGRMAILRLVILPQALRIMLPALTGQIISVFKDSALASLISLPDLTFQSLEIMAISRMTFEIWITTAILYLLLGLLCASAGRWLEKKFSQYHH